MNRCQLDLINIKELCQGLLALTNLRSLHLARFMCEFTKDLLSTLWLPSITDFELSDTAVTDDHLQGFIHRHSGTIKTVLLKCLDLRRNCSWSGVLRSLTRLTDAKLICISYPVENGRLIQLGPGDEGYSTFNRYVMLDGSIGYCDCWPEGPGCSVPVEYRLGTDAKREDFTRGLKLMMDDRKVDECWCKIRWRTE